MNRQTDPLKHFLKTGDNGPPLRRTILDPKTGLPRNFTGSTVKIIVNNPDGSAKINRAAVIEYPPTSGRLRADWQTGDFSAPGNYPAEFEETTLSGEVVTYPPNREEPAKRYIYIIVGPDLAV